MNESNDCDFPTNIFLHVFCRFIDIGACLVLFLQEGKLALLSHLQRFLSADEEDNIVAKSQSAGVNEIIKIRSQLQKEEVNPNEPPPEEKGNLKQVEINYVYVLLWFTYCSSCPPQGGVNVHNTSPLL